MTEEMRMESDSIGTMEVPKEAYYRTESASCIYPQPCKSKEGSGTE